MRRLILLNLPICAMLTFLFGAAFHLRGTDPPVSPADVCSENPAYAEAIVAQQYVTHPTTQVTSTAVMPIWMASTRVCWKKAR